MLLIEEPPPPHCVTASAERSIATCQKAIYGFHESHHPDRPVVDIYSLPWQNRLTAWYPWYARYLARQRPQLAKTARHSHPITSPPQFRPAKIDIRVLFFTHPVRAFALWGVLEAFQALDVAVCGWAASSSSSSSCSCCCSKDENISCGNGDHVIVCHNHWQAMKPLEYLDSKEIKCAWKAALETLRGDIGSGRLAGGKLERRIWGIYVGIEGVEERVEGLLGDCAIVDVLMGGIGGFEYIGEIVQRVMDERCLMIDEILGAEGTKQTIGEVQENEKGVLLITAA